MYSQTIKLLKCIRCGGRLGFVKKLVCLKCGMDYKVKKDIPIMLGEMGSVDTVISKKNWERIYKSELIRKGYEDDLQIMSHLKFILEYEKYFKKGIYLDLGCGISRTTPYLVKRNVEIIGIDISYEGVYKSKLLMKQNKLRGDFIQADFLDIPLKNNGIDFIYWGLALEYVEDTQRAVDEAYRVLRKGGRVLAAFPVVSVGNLTYQQLRGDIPRVKILGPIVKFIHVNVLKGRYLKFGYGQSFTTRGIKSVFQKSGFKSIKIGYFDTYYPIDFLPKLVQPLFRRLLRWRPFWPFAYIEAMK